MLSYRAYEEKTRLNKVRNLLISNELKWWEKEVYEDLTNLNERIFSFKIRGWVVINEKGNYIAINPYTKKVVALIYSPKLP